MQGVYRTYKLGEEGMGFITTVTCLIYLLFNFQSSPPLADNNYVRSLTLLP
jgi:hypothetical protein